MHLLPHFPILLGPVAIFGITLLLGLIGGEIARRIPYIPVVLGYIAIGFLIGPGGLNIIKSQVIETGHVFVKVSLSLVLFELGRNLDFRWLSHDKGLFLMALAESSFAFLFLFLFSYLGLHLNLLQSAFIGTIAIATSPAVVMLVASDTSSSGPVTRRILCLTSLNNLFALIIFSLLLPFTESHKLPIATLLIQSIYRVAGSFILGLIMYFITECIAALVKKNRENHFVLFIGLVTLTANLAYIFNLSTMLALLSLGMIARNIDRKHRLMEVDFSWLSRLFFILLFVVVGVHLQFEGFLKATGIVLIFILVRGSAKTLGICLFTNKSNLTRQQTFAISLALLPMAEMSINMSNFLINANPYFDPEFFMILSSVVTLLYIIGPIATQYAFVVTGEAISPLGSKISRDTTIHV